jgi:ankyrin repeat protein
MERVQLLLQKGAAVNARGGRYGSALQAAKAAGRAKIAKAFVDAGAQELD